MDTFSKAVRLVQKLEGCHWHRAHRLCCTAHLIAIKPAQSFKPVVDTTWLKVDVNELNNDGLGLRCQWAVYLPR